MQSLHEKIHAMEVLDCLICLENAQNSRMCPTCSKIFCAQCLLRCNGSSGGYGTIPCPHCRDQRPVSNYVNLSNLTDVLRQDRDEERKYWEVALAKKEDQLKTAQETWQRDVEQKEEQIAASMGQLGDSVERFERVR